MFAQVPKPPPRSKKLSSAARNSLNCDAYDLELIAYPSKDRPYKKVARSLTLPSKRGENRVILNKNERLYRTPSFHRPDFYENTIPDEPDHENETPKAQLRQLSENFERELSSTPIANEQLLSPKTKFKLLTKLTTLLKLNRVVSK